jgi:carbonic anhydrase/acetyltransferase-like protein (isoleucine patch superfamily)
MTHRPLVAGVGGKQPQVHPEAFAAPTSVVIGDVTLAAHCGVWYHAVLRADCGPIVLGAESNVQDNCTVHVDPGFPVTVGERVSVGHNAVLHGCTVEDDVLVGMGATVLNGAHVGSGSLIAAQALVPQGMRVPPGSLVAGVPARVTRELTDEEREGILLNARTYRDLAREHRQAAERLM